MIKTESVIVYPSHKSRQHYVDLGYSQDSKCIEVPVSDLHTNCMALVIAACDDCGLEREVKFGQYRPFCPACARKGERNANWKGGKPKCIDCGGDLANNACTTKVVLRCRPCHDAWYVGDKVSTYKHERNFCACGSPKSRGTKCLSCYLKNVHNPYSTKRTNSDTRWSLEVKEMAGYACDCCKSEDDLHAHHLESFMDNEPLRRELSNGVCLCKTCHLEFHKQYGFGDNTTEQYLEFKEAVYASN